jgi:manganese/zinc/iron transport system permease protein
MIKNVNMPAFRMCLQTTFRSFAVVFLLPATAAAGSLAELSLEWPTWAELIRVLTLRDYNTRVVVIGTTLLGLAAGLVGTFLLLRKRALLSDALSHATLPGIALAFIVMSHFGNGGKNLLGLIGGAAVFSVLGTVSVILIQRYSRLKDDAALGIVLSVYFGLGIALLGLATRMETGNAAGLTSFIYGKTASMLFFDAILIAGTALGSAIFCLMFFKEFALICFDQNYAATQGWPVVRLDFLMMALIVIVTVVGLQAVGLILVVALLIIPPSAARFWTHRLSTLLALSGFLGALSGLIGSTVSALMANLPAGAVIVLVAALTFAFSLTFGSARGLIVKIMGHQHLRKKILRENLLRTMYELAESRFKKESSAVSADQDAAAFHFPELLNQRSWTSRQLRKALQSLRKAQLLTVHGKDRYTLTEKGFRKASKVVRNHRLWEAYLITHAEVAPSQVDWGADKIEHVLDKEMIDQLEKLVPELLDKKIPPSPHEVSIRA